MLRELAYCVLDPDPSGLKIRFVDALRNLKHVRLEQSPSMSIDSALASIEQTTVEERMLKELSNEWGHFTIAFNLFREAASYLCILANTTVGYKPTWNVGQAVLGGNLVRMFKLMCFVMEESIERRAELLWILARLLGEGAINLRFLIRNFSEELINSYVVYSLQHEKKLADLIRTNIQQRDGMELPIEVRMLRSIERTFRNSAITEDSLPSRTIRNWGSKNLFEKAKSVDLENAYDAVFGGPSRNVHGGWQDLLQHHLDCDSPGEFHPRLGFTRPRPQLVYSLTNLIAETLIEYGEFLQHPSMRPVLDRLHGLVARNELASQLHEAYLVTKAG